MELTPKCNNCDRYSVTYLNKECSHCQGHSMFKEKICDECSQISKETIYVMISNQEYHICIKCFQTVFKGNDKLIIRQIG